LVAPSRGGFSPQLAQYVLELKFSSKDQTLYQRLSAKARAGKLTAAEKDALDDLLTAADVLAILQSKARVSLKRRNPAA
ncbi:MAG TPA: hypothetical protein VH370_21905, partial [Humisphaera sp.]|nr:hypothetical protein [Humisphaera sp.]